MSHAKAIEAVFISDLHLHPDEPSIEAKLDAFVAWALKSTKVVYILGDFFHAWPGDDALDAWSEGIAKKIFQLKKAGIAVFYMHGNRDFLLGEKFASLAGWRILSDPSVIDCGKEKILLAHGDGYCTKDRRHQLFRALTRNAFFSNVFMQFPLKLRKKLVDSVRQFSQKREYKTLEQFDVVSAVCIRQMRKKNVQYLIHGHTHKPGLHVYDLEGKPLARYVLSDWDDNPQILCYYSTNRFDFVFLCDGSEYGQA